MPREPAHSKDDDAEAGAPSGVRPGQVSNSESPYAAGALIADKYRLVRLLGEGGMGAVWVAHNEALDTHVAIKVLRGEARAELSSRLLTEARAAARLGHPAIVRVFDFGVTGKGDPFIVMELLDGEDLGTALERRGRISAKRAVQIMLPIVHALSEAHKKGIVHRDLKPENIFLTRFSGGRIHPKLVDFGIAKLDRMGFERVTQAGAVLGSPEYLSPEQARGEDVDARADTWAVCVVLYEMCAGRAPFEAKNYNALLRAIIEDEPPPSTDFLAGDSALWEIVKKGLAKNPADRWPQIWDLGHALAEWLVAYGVHEDIAGASLQAMWLESESAEDVLPAAEPLTNEDIEELRPSPPPRGLINTLKPESGGPPQSVEPRDTGLVGGRRPAGGLTGETAASAPPVTSDQSAGIDQRKRGLLLVAALLLGCIFLGVLLLREQPKAERPVVGDTEKASATASPVAPPADSQELPSAAPRATSESEAPPRSTSDESAPNVAAPAAAKTTEASGSPAGGIQKPGRSAPARKGSAAPNSRVRDLKLDF